jgi:pimeloyl-ACP methyl ester carboxylesterase
MDGTGRLFGPFSSALPGWIRPSVIDYGDATALADAARALPALDEPYALIAESYSGLVAVQALVNAARPPVALVLVASFMTTPRAVPRWLAASLLPVMFSLPPPASALRWALLGDDASDEIVAWFAATLSSVRGRILAARLRAILDADLSMAFSTLTIPTLYVRGARDRLVPARVAEELQARRPDLRVETLDAPHLVLQRCPVEAARLIADFLAPRSDQSAADLVGE